MPTVNPFEHPLRKLHRAVEQAKDDILDKMGTIAVNFTFENFEKQGFQGTVFEPWQPRKKETKKTTGKNILTNTARLRNSTRYNKGADSVTIHNNVEYAQVHNEGGTIHHPERSGIMNFGRAKRGGLKLGKIQTLGQRKRIVAQAKFTMGAHDTQMPKRQFIGYSPVLNKRVEPMVIAEILKTFKTL